MILKALYDYYYKCLKDFIPFGTALVNFKYAILIDEDGKYKDIEELGNKTGITILTFRPEERSNNIIPHSLGDNGKYILGLYDIKNNSDIEYLNEFKKNQEKHDAFKNDVEKLHKVLPENKHLKSIYLFYQKYNLDTIKEMSLNVNWDKLSKNLNKNITFRIKGNTELAASDKEVIKYKINNLVNKNKQMVCLISGKNEVPINTTYSTPIKDSKSNAKLISFQKTSGYDSYGKQQGLNAPISDDAEFAYTTALNYMLRSESRNKFQIGNRTFLFWASNNNEAGKQVEESIWNLFGFNDTKEDDPNKNIENVRKVFNSIYSGEIKTTLEDKFYILGLAPNAARIAVTYWAEIPLADFAKLIKRHFDDMDIIDCRKVQKPYMGLHSILSSVTLKGQIYGDDSKLIPNLPEAVVKSIFQGIPYPQTLYASCIRRIHAETSNEDKDRDEKNMKKNAISITRAAIIKAYLNRLNNNEQKITFMLDKTNTNQGYLCGRLFAVLDKIQGDANNQHSIKERYMNAASTTPATVFSTILNLSVHHSENLNEGRKIFFEKIKQEIIEKIDSNGFPTHLDLQDQGRFFVGYYHQIQSFYNTNEEQPEN